MQIGIITVDGAAVGVVTMESGDDIADPFVPDLEGYEPQGRADRPLGGPSSDHAGVGHRGHHGGGAAPGEHSRVHRPGHHAPPSHPYEPGGGYETPPGKTYDGGEARPVRQGSAETDQAIVDAARAHHLDVNTMRGIASIESSMNPSSNANRSTQYKGLYQIGHEEWRRFGEGNIYSARDNAMAAARMFEANRNQFREHYGRDPTDTELYMMHQQGFGFLTPGIKKGQNAAGISNQSGNPYPGMRGPQTRESFEAGWGRELARRKAGFAARTAPRAEASPKPAPTTPEEAGVMPAAGPLGRGRPVHETGREFYDRHGNIKHNPYAGVFTHPGDVEDRRRQKTPGHQKDTAYDPLNRAREYFQSVDDDKDHAASQLSRDLGLKDIPEPLTDEEMAKKFPDDY